MNSNKEKNPIFDILFDSIMDESRFKIKYEGLLPDIVSLAETLKWKTEDKISIRIINDEGKSSIIIDNLSMSKNILPEDEKQPFYP